MLMELHGSIILEQIFWFILLGLNYIAKFQKPECYNLSRSLR